MTAGPVEAVHSWWPHSPCGSWCLPSEGSLPGVSPARLVLRLVSLASVVLLGPLAALSLSVLGPRGRSAVLRGWFRLLLRALGTRLRVYHPGALVVARPREGGGVLVVGNHTSWLDVAVLNALRPVRMLAKREVRDWPLIGVLAARAGTFFLDRRRLSALPGTVAQLASAMRAGAAVGVFPEGTTWCGPASGPYRHAAFQAALDAGVPVRPVGLRFMVADRETTAASFIGEEGLLTSLLRAARLRGLVVEAHVLPLVHPEGHDRRSMARTVETAVCAALGHTRHTEHRPGVAAAA
ncbi:1-acyl-sn-glycerol-3-phosphate acyltransferase [Crossiella equi]|uniref:1-acyl-sn-glycerol-3-phosphate acyltransferase n=1 Tax=Crossiella equi TaxID=130796 RepID=A0ABS5AJZ9_9PSEU|nr:lysophospholipid acyltransferase family protein [Crossiella equi]MBP2476900.1 1-acyl-sn-glycerol-3-phosphate acyltransferase [Crossiella equi]